MMIVPVATSTRAPSQRQSAIFAHIEQSVKRGVRWQDLIVSAVPGSGKSTSITWSIRYFPARTSTPKGEVTTDVAFVTFGRAANDDLSKKVEAEKNLLQELGLPSAKVEVR